jgi:hypothetical protein
MRAKPKFEFGDIVECCFNGVVEGVPVVVRKRLFVQGVSGYVTNASIKLSFRYNVCENDVEKHSESGRVYTKEEHELTELEPVVQEVERNNRVFVAPAINQIDQMQQLQQIFSQAKKAQQAHNPWTSAGLSSGSSAASSQAHTTDYSSLLSQLRASGLAGGGSAEELFKAD